MNNQLLGIALILCVIIVLVGYWGSKVVDRLDELIELMEEKDESKS